MQAYRQAAQKWDEVCHAAEGRCRVASATRAGEEPSRAQSGFNRQRPLAPCCTLSKFQSSDMRVTMQPASQIFLCHVIESSFAS